LAGVNALAIVGVKSPLHSSRVLKVIEHRYRVFVWPFKIRTIATIVFQFRVVAGTP
jgi:hypothetical protein